MPSQLLALCVFHAIVGVTTAFSVSSPKTSAVLLKSSSSSESSSHDHELFPPGTFQRYQTIQGGGTVQTFQMPPWAERVQYSLKTNGRPMSAIVELWLGPIRKTHRLEIEMQDGAITPYQATLKFKKGPQVLRISTGSSTELPLLASVSVPSEERSAELGAHTEKLWENCPPEQKQIIQGGSVQGGGGAIRTWTIPYNVDRVQVLAWSKDVSKKSFRCRIECLQGPNNKKQEFMLQCGGGSQPYHAIYETPGDGWVIRMTNLKFLEDGLVEFAVLPYSSVGGRTGSIQPGSQTGSTGASRFANPQQSPRATKQWWE